MKRIAEELHQTKAELEQARREIQELRGVARALERENPQAQSPAPANPDCEAQCRILQNHNQDLLDHIRGLEAQLKGLQTRSSLDNQYHAGFENEAAAEEDERDAAPEIQELGVDRFNEGAPMVSDGEETGKGT